MQGYQVIDEEDIPLNCFWLTDWIYPKASAAWKDTTGCNYSLSCLQLCILPFHSNYHKSQGEKFQTPAYFRIVVVWFYPRWYPYHFRDTQCSHLVSHGQLRHFANLEGKDVLHLREKGDALPTWQDKVDKGTQQKCCSLG